MVLLRIAGRALAGMAKRITVDMANLDCTIEEMYERGDHLIVIGRVPRAHSDPMRDPLLSLQGKYRRSCVVREELTRSVTR
jgi:flavin reductase (DIM6/NTAB) family NADH-FMN oxidoreductase RutF